MLGDGGDEGMRARMRAQANFVEYTLLPDPARPDRDGEGQPDMALGRVHRLCAGAIAHAFGMDSATPSKLRAGGILVTWAVLLGLAVYALTILYAAGAVTATTIPA